MKIRKQFLLLFLVTAIILSSCNIQTSSSEGNRNIILKNDYTNEKRNELLKADINFFGKQLTDKHKNPFHNITKEEFDANLDTLISKVGELTNIQVFVEMNKIIASLGDAHTGINYWDGFFYPLRFYCFNEGIYIIDADKSLEDILYTKVKKINGVDINIIIEQLKILIPHENEYWLKERLPDYLSVPVYMYGLGIIPDEEKTEFEFEGLNGEIIKNEIDILKYGEKANYISINNNDRDIYLFDQQNEDFYWYEYLNNDNILYFKYNVCANMEEINFISFSDSMF